MHSQPQELAGGQGPRPHRPSKSHITFRAADRSPQNWGSGGQNPAIPQSPQGENSVVAGNANLLIGALRPLRPEQTGTRKIPLAHLRPISRSGYQTGTSTRQYQRTRPTPDIEGESALLPFSQNWEKGPGVEGESAFLPFSQNWEKGPGVEGESALLPFSQNWEKGPGVEGQNPAAPRRPLSRIGHRTNPPELRVTPPAVGAVVQLTPAESLLRRTVLCCFASFVGYNPIPWGLRFGWPDALASGAKAARRTKLAESLVPALVLLVAFMPGVAHADYAAEVRQDHPSVWLRFQDPSAAEGSTARDAMGQHPGTYHGTVALEPGPVGVNGSAALFDGKSGIVEIPIDPKLAAGALSIECWFRSKQVWNKPNWPASATIASKGTEGDGSSDWVILGGSSDMGQPGCVIARPGPNPGTDAPLASPGGLNDGDWYHFLWSRSLAGQNKLWINGILVATRQDSGGSIRNDRPIQIGGDPWLKGKYLNGSIAEFAIYDKVLDEVRIAAHARAGGAKRIQFAMKTDTAVSPAPVPQPLVLRPETFQPYVETFNRQDREHVTTLIPNAQSWDWIRQNTPLFECPDKDIEQTYYFRWWTYRKHIKQTPQGYVVTEFLPEVGWAGKYNTISCSAAHHFYEGRWIADPRYLDDYSTFWFRKGGEPRRYSFWAADSLYKRYLVTGDPAVPKDLLPDLIANYHAWETDHRDPNGLFWQIDDRDGMEVSIGGSGYRATINSYQYGDAMAISRIAEMAGKKDLADQFRQEAEKIKQLVETNLWDKDAQFFKVLPRGEGKKLADVREEHGYTPWYFDLPDEQYSSAWKQLMDPQGFYAPFGPTTAERRHPRFMFHNDHECLWNGPSWPFSTCITLTALANLLNDYHQDAIGKKDYLDLLDIYARSQHLKLPDGTTVPWIDEDLDPDTGDWTARTILAKAGTHDRGKDYNHSTYCDLVISGLAGLRPRADETVEVNPLVPADRWDYFCLDQVRYHGRWLTILFDRTGDRYHKGKGLHVFADGTEVAHSDNLERVTGPLPPRKAGDAETTAGWVKYPSNPVLGGSLGTCFDISVMKENDLYRMWFSWRPKQSVALVESKDGIHWSAPQIVLPPDKATGWEDDINRPVVLKREDGYHMWYTGQAHGQSWIGYATSPDGKTWKRMSQKPVVSPEKPWEKVAVMCPSVLWDTKTKNYRMWYSGGEQYEPDEIGYATSPDGLTWTKHDSPVFGPDPNNYWESHKVAGCQVIQHGDEYLLFYIGYRDIDHAQIGVARSTDGITNWQRHPENPIVRPGHNKWDHDACYKPFAIFDGKQWLLWYNGRHGGLEQVGLVTHQGEDLGFRN